MNRTEMAVTTSLTYAAALLTGWLMAALTFTNTLPGSSEWQSELKWAIGFRTWAFEAPGWVEVIAPGLILTVVATVLLYIVLSAKGGGAYESEGCE